MRPSAAAYSRRRQARARLDDQRHRGQPQALAEDADRRVEGERDEEAVRAAAGAERAEVQHRLDGGGGRHREGGDGHRQAGAGLARLRADESGRRECGSGSAGRWRGHRGTYAAGAAVLTPLLQVQGAPAARCAAIVAALRARS